MAYRTHHSEPQFPSTRGGSRKSYLELPKVPSLSANTQPFSYHNNSVLESQYRLLLSASNCTSLQCLRTLDSATLKRAAQQTFVDAYNSDPALYAFGDFYYGPSVDGDVIRDLPSNEWKQGHFTKVPLLVDHDGYVRCHGYPPSRKAY